MPTYQYACTGCGHRFEAVQSFSDDALTECPECAERLRKVFSAVGVVFKGSGFYRNDSRPAGKNGSSDRDSADPKPAKSPDKAAAASGSSSSSEGSRGGDSSKSPAGSSSAKPTGDKSGSPSSRSSKSGAASTGSAA